MNIDAIENGIVIDHIPAGRGMKLYELLGLDKLSCSVAIIMNAHSNKNGKKDIIKIDTHVELNYDIIGFVSPKASINIIRDGILSEKKSAGVPEMLRDVIKCQNPRCITTTEQELSQLFRLTDREKGVYRCVYCDTMASDV